MNLDMKENLSQQKEMELLITEIHNVVNKFDKLNTISESESDIILSYLPMDKISGKIEDFLSLSSYIIKEEIEPFKEKIEFILDEIDKIIRSENGEKIKILYPELKKMQESIDKIYY